MTAPATPGARPVVRPPHPAPSRTRRRPPWRRLVVHAVLLAGAVVVLYPILWMVSASLKPEDEIFAGTSLIPSRVQWRNYVDGWFALPGLVFGRFLLNSLVVAGLSVLGTVVSCTMAAYAFARLRFRGRLPLFAVMLATIMLPFHVVAIPRYVLFSELGWIDTFLPLVVPKFLAADAFFVFLLVQFIRGIPRELDDAARVDGCSAFGIFWHVVLPLCRPALVTTAILTFIWTWDDFFSHLVFLNSSENYTVAVGLRLFLDSSGASSFGPMLAMAVVSLIPVLVFFVVFQRYIVQGIATQGIKG
ncbi:MAG: carbohydrate ABC transporter permease [Kineosporiaceae bacterium]